MNASCAQRAGAKCTEYPRYPRMGFWTGTLPQHCLLYCIYSILKLLVLCDDLPCINIPALTAWAFKLGTLGGQSVTSTVRTISVAVLFHHRASHTVVFCEHPAKAMWGVQPHAFNQRILMAEVKKYYVNHKSPSTTHFRRTPVSRPFLQYFFCRHNFSITQKCNDDNRSRSNLCDMGAQAAQPIIRISTYQFPTLVIVSGPGPCTTFTCQARHSHSSSAGSTHGFRASHVSAPPKATIK